MLKPLTVWITTNCGNFLNRWEYQTTWSASWEICVQVRKQQLKPDMKQCVCVLSHSVVSDSCDPTDCSLPGSSVHGILQARTLEWVAVSFCRGSSQPRNQTWVSYIAGRLFTNWATKEAHEMMDWFKIGKGVWKGYILSPCLFNLYVEYIIWSAGLEEQQAGIRIAGRNINNLRYANDTMLMAESEELKILLMKVKEETEKAGLKLSIQKMKIWHLVPSFHGK